jgi:ribosomal protein S18 acetylase RimI-like enzyme
MTPVIRDGGTPDVEALLLLWREADVVPRHTDTAESVGALLTHDPGALIVAEDDHHIVGSVIAGWDGWRGSVYRLAVASSHRRMGLGRRLVRQAEVRFSDLGAHRLQAIVLETSPVATAFWAASGWEQQVGRLRFVKG